ncbi:MAG: M3 family metallopeptidase [Planctomycetota bacterium]
MIEALLALLTGLVLSPAIPAAEESSETAITSQLAAADAAVDRIVAIPAQERTVANSLVALDDAVAALIESTSMVGFMAEVSTDPSERDAGREARIALSRWFDRLEKDERMFRALEELAALDPTMTDEERRFFDETMRDYRRAGLDLSESSSARLDAIDRELVELESEFRATITADETFVLFTEDELAGAPADWLEGLPRANGLCIVDMKGPNLGYVLGYCDDAVTRRKIGCAAGLRGGRRNVRTLEAILALRHERANLLGYPTAAAYVVETRMAKTPEAIVAFYDDLRPKLRRKAALDLAEFEAAMREHTGDPNAAFESSDVLYYTNWLKREKYDVDTRSLREYFPLDSVLEGMFGVFQNLFAVTFEDVTAEARATGRPLWHEDVRLYAVHDDASGELLGEFYIDLHPREGKFGYAAQFPLRLRKVWPDGSVSTPLVALVCSLAKPEGDRPSLLLHREVVTLFHEFGHCLHSILTRANLATFAGTNVARDFVEAPSQMLENWTWGPEILARFARHYETGEPLPASIIEGMVAAKNLGSGINAEGQVYLGLMDLRYHTDDDGIVDTTEVCEQTFRETRMFEPAENLVRQAAFGHLVGYESGYYSYLWSSVYAQDMWSRFADDPMNADTARAYRRVVLEPGGTRDALEIVREFLGREPNATAFLAHLGLD